LALSDTNMNDTASVYFSCFIQHQSDSALGGPQMASHVTKWIFLFFVTGCAGQESGETRAGDREIPATASSSYQSLNLNCPDFTQSFAETLYSLSDECLNALPPMAELESKLRQHGYNLEEISDDLLALAVWKELSKDYPDVKDDAREPSLALAELGTIPPVFFDIGKLKVSTGPTLVNGSIGAGCEDNSDIIASASLNADTEVSFSIARQSIASIDAPVLRRKHELSAAGSGTGPINAQISGCISGNLKKWNLNIGLLASGEAQATVVVWNRIVTDRGIDRGTNEAGNIVVNATFSLRDSLSINGECGKGSLSIVTKPVSKNFQITSAWVDITGGIFRPRRDGPTMQLIRKAVERFINAGRGRAIVQQVVDSKLSDYIESYESVRTTVEDAMVKHLPEPSCDESTSPTLRPPTTSTTNAPSTTIDLGQTTTTTIPSSTTFPQQTSTTHIPSSTTFPQQTSTTHIPSSTTFPQQTSTTHIPSSTTLPQQTSIK
jgi:hypothetical protein